MTDIDRRRDSRILAARTYGQEIVNRGRRSSDRNALTNVDEEDEVALREAKVEAAMDLLDKNEARRPYCIGADLINAAPSYAPRARAFWQRCVESDDVSLCIMLLTIAAAALFVGIAIGYYLGGT